MAYGQATTTNNYAEYQGLCHGLAAAEKYKWAPMEVIGDSMMIIRQLSTRHKPKAPSLRPFYERARSTALRVRRWHHHYRSHNKMADKAANQAMDKGASYQATAESGRAEFHDLRDWLLNDVREWAQARLLPP